MIVSSRNTKAQNALQKIRDIFIWAAAKLRFNDYRTKHAVYIVQGAVILIRSYIGECDADSRGPRRQLGRTGPVRRLGYDKSGVQELAGRSDGASHGAVRIRSADVGGNRGYKSAGSVPKVIVCGSVGSTFVHSTDSPLWMRMVPSRKRTTARYCVPPPVATISPVPASTALRGLSFTSSFWLIAILQYIARFVGCGLIVEMLAMKQSRICGVIHQNVNRAVHIGMDQANQFVISGFRELHRERCAAVQTGGGGDASTAVVNRRRSAGYTSEP